MHSYITVTEVCIEAQMHMLSPTLILLFNIVCDFFLHTTLKCWHSKGSILRHFLCPHYLSFWVDFTPRPFANT